MKTKTIFLLLILSFSILPANTVKAEVSVQRFADSAVSLMYISDAILYGDTDQEDFSGTPALLSPVYDDTETDLDNAKLSAQIHALKMKRNDRDKNCELMIRQYKAAGKDCEADRLKSNCAAEKASINAQIGKLHKLRGDRRRSLTKAWHFLKRNGQTAWRKLGPKGRRFFHKMGPELMQMVATGGFGGSAAKSLFKTHLKRAFGKSQIKKIALKRIQRMISGQFEIAQAAGLDICDPEKEETRELSDASKKDTSNSKNGKHPDGATWKCKDVNGILSNLKFREAAWMKTQSSKLNLYFTYDSNSNSLLLNYGYDVAENWAVTQVDGSIGDWHILTMFAQTVDLSVPIDEHGVFKGTLHFNVNNTERGKKWDTPTVENYWGLIPADQPEKAYVCTTGKIPLPESFGTLSGENFRDHCGTYRYYECALSTP